MACPPVRDHQGHNSLQARIASAFLSVSQPPKQGENNPAPIPTVHFIAEQQLNKQPWTETSGQPRCAAQPGAGFPTILHLRPLRVSVLPGTPQLYTGFGGKGSSFPGGETRDA